MSQTDERALHPLEIQIGHRFRDPGLLRMALTHTSFWNEYPDVVDSDNQRLEFLGDAVLDLMVADWLYRRTPEVSEGEMTALRAMLVRQESLADVAVALHVGEHMLLGKGEEEGGGRTRAVNLCGAVESVVGALYLDGGIDVVRAWVMPAIERELDRSAGTRDPKSLLQEWVQARLHLTPTYRTVSAEGPDHARQFIVEAVVGDNAVGRGQGPSKQIAAQQAAHEALINLQTKHEPT
jgi:ribonuclease III